MSLKEPISLGMSEHHRALLDRYTEPICRDLLTERVVRKMMGKILDEEDWQEINGQKSSDMKAWALISLLKKKGPHAFDAFVQVLKETQPYLAAPLMEEGRVRPQLPREPSESDETIPKIPVEVDTDGNITEPLMEELKCQEIDLVYERSNYLKDNTFESMPVESSDYAEKEGSDESTESQPDRLTQMFNICPQNSCTDNTLQNGCNGICEGPHALMDSLKGIPDNSTLQMDRLKHEPSESICSSDAVNSNQSVKSDIKSAYKKQSGFSSMESTNQLDSEEDRTLTSSLVNNTSQCSCLGACGCDNASHMLSSKTQNDLNKLENFNVQQMRALSTRLNLNISEMNKFEKVDKMMGILVKQSPVHHIVEALETEEVNRRDVAMVLRKHLPVEAGPKLDPDLPILKLRFTVRHKLINELSLENKNGHDWRLLAEHLGFSEYIELWRQRYDLPAEPLLLSWQVRSEATVGTLHKLLNKLNMGAIAEIL